LEFDIDTSGDPESLNHLVTMVPQQINKMQQRWMDAESVSTVVSFEV